jgi:hypothetical protein
MLAQAAKRLSSQKISEKRKAASSVAQAQPHLWRRKTDDEKVATSKFPGLKA